jgi:hypothetical protein
MNTTLVGVFKTASDARQAWCRLAAAGVHNTDIRLDVEEWPWDEAAPTERREMQEGRSAVGRFFFELLERVNDAARNLFRPGLTDHFILTIAVVGSERVEQMETVLDDCGAIDIEEQAEARLSDGAMPASVGQFDRRVDTARPLYRLSDRWDTGESSTRSRKA